MTEALANDPSARTETGEIKPATTTQETQTSLTSSQPSETKPPESNEASLASGKPPAAPGAPEKYEDFKLPEGVELKGDQLKAATDLFKQVGLSQEAAQQMIDFHVNQIKSISEGPAKAIRDMRTGWRDSVKADPVLSAGGQIKGDVMSSISRAIDSLGADLAPKFRQAMDETGIGDNPVFVRAFYELSKKVTEGRPVAAGGPSANGQRNPAAGSPSAAKAMYPNLPSNG